MKFPERLRARARRIYLEVNRRTGGAPKILQRTLARYGETQASEAAAGLAYYLFFSLFPLLLVLVTTATYVWKLDSGQAFQQAVNFISQAVPISRSVISDNLQAVLQQRGTIGIVSLIGTIWSASSAFAVLTRNVNQAWSQTKERGFLKQRLTALAMVGVLVLLLFLSLAASAVGRLVPRLNLANPQLDFFKTVLWSLVLSQVLPFLLSMLLFVALYRWVPAAKPSWRAVLWGAGVTTVAWELAKAGFSWFVSSGLSSYNLVYGSLGSVVALIFWVYLSASVALFGAHLTAAIDWKETI